MPHLNARRRRNMRRSFKSKTPEEIAARESFRDTARAQRCCQHPDCKTPTAPWDAHHVVYEQHVRAEGCPPYDDRNAMRLCKTCHGRHHSGQAPLPQSILTAANLAYAREVLGERHADYFNMHYIPESPI